jgi:hypothetical protein
MKILKFISVTMTVIAVLLFKLTAFAQGIHQTAQTKFVVVKGESLLIENLVMDQACHLYFSNTLLAQWITGIRP